MAVENLRDRFFLNNRHVQRFTIVDEDNGGQPLNISSRVLKWAMTRIDPVTGDFDPTTVDVEKATGDMTIVDGPNGIVDVIIDDADTVSLPEASYHFQLEVFDGAGDDGVVVSAGEAELVANLQETV